MANGLNSREARKVRELKAELQGWRCYYCGCDICGRATLDHLIPKSRGGKIRDDNFVAACWPCNQSKGNKMPEEFSPSFCPVP